MCKQYKHTYVQSPYTDAPGHASHLDSVLDFTSVVSDDEGRLHDSRELDVAVSFMLTLELVQQGLIGSLGETRGDGDFIRRRFKTQIMEILKLLKLRL